MSAGRNRLRLWPVLSQSSVQPALRRLWSYTLFFLFDGLVVAGSYALGLWLYWDGRVPDSYASRFPLGLLAIVPIYLAVNRLLRTYWRGWRYASIHDALALAQAVGVSTLVVFALDAPLAPSVRPIPLSVVPVAGLFTLLGMGVGRFRHRLLQELIVLGGRTSRHRVLIVGAGQAGQWLARELLGTPSWGYRPICFVDDDPEKQSQRLHGLPVAGTRHDIQRLVREHKLDVIAFAIPSMIVEERRQVLGLCEETAARIKIMQGIPEMLTAEAQVSVFRDARIEDLLGRPPVVFADGRLDGPLSRRVLVTGAAGSIGSELARQLAAGGAEQLILLDANESGLYDLTAELERYTQRGLRLDVVVASVTHAKVVAQVFEQYRPTAVFHAAAYKHVPLMEAYPTEAVFANVVGTYNACLAAARSGCERFVFVSTDKAAEPANVMGATKRLGERIVEAFSDDGGTRFCAVRFGNVLGSRGSVVPRFEQQIRQGGPVTITHRQITRFFMTIPEAVNLIIEASRQDGPGGIFILDMGDPVAILDLARKLIRVHGLRPDEDIEILEIGMRPGEKLHEVLVSSDEKLVATMHPRVSRVVPPGTAPIRREDVAEVVEYLTRLADNGSTEALVQALFAMARDARVDVVGRRS